MPAALGSLGALEELALHRNRLKGAVPAALGGCANLKVLYLHANAGLAGPVPEELGDLVLLERLLLAETKVEPGSAPKALLERGCDVQISPPNRE